MRLLVNENVPIASVRTLRDAGHEVASASEIMAGAADQTVLEHAVKEDRVILTSIVITAK